MELPGSQFAVVVKKNRPAWQRLTRTISQSFDRKKKAPSLPVVPIALLAAGTPASKSLKRSAATQVSFAPRSDVAVGASMEGGDGERQRVESDVSRHDVVSEGNSPTNDSSDAVSDPAEAFSSKRSLPERSIVDTVPVEFPLVQYVAECCLLLQQDAGDRPRAASASDVETRLFFKCVELEKWSLAHTLAEKMQRRIAGCLREQREQREPSDCGTAEGRIRRARRAERESEARDEVDVVLQFLDTCAS